MGIFDKLFKDKKEAAKMKKVISVLLVLVLLIPAFAFASESDIVGCWASYTVLNDGAPSMSMLYLSADHTCFYLVQMFHPEREGLGRTYIGTWKLNGDGTLYVKTGNNTDMTLRFSDSGNLAVNMETMEVYANITPFTFR